MRLNHAVSSDSFGRRLFRFVVIADTHITPEDDRSSSPFNVNAKANERGRTAFEDLNRWHPEFVVHVGDLVHPVPELAGFVPACERFKALCQAIKSPIHLIPGNHDVGDKPVDWMPAGTVRKEFVEKYRKIFGPDFYSFDSNGVHCILINAQVINSGLQVESEQRDWLERDFARNSGKRTFVFTHYPPYVSDRDEPSNYDNIDEPGRTWLLDLLARYKPEALFAGHVHHQWYDIFGETEMYILPSTAFARQDYSELFRVAPLGEYGRDDWTKLGYYLIDVYERGHVSHFIRTNGLAQQHDDMTSVVAPVSPVHTKTNAVAIAGVDMRHAWIEWTDVAATGGVQEFERKRTRNDYPAVALWEMGVRKLRIPLQDILDERVRQRMQLLQRVGHGYTAYTFGVPQGDSLEALRRHPGLIEAIEVILVWDKAAEVIPRLSVLREELGVTIWLSKLRRHEDAKFDGSHFNHFINHGFVLAERVQLEKFLADQGAREAVNGFVGRVVRDRSPWSDLRSWDELASELKIIMTAHVRLAADNPAKPLEDDLATANRVAETLIAARCCSRLNVFFDTFCDVDRNYFPHHGFVDRRYDPRLAAHVYRNLHALSSANDMPVNFGGSGSEDGIRWFHVMSPSSQELLIMTDGERKSLSGFLLPDGLSGTQVVLIDLHSGGKFTASVKGRKLVADHLREFSTPVLVQIKV